MAAEELRKQELPDEEGGEELEKGQPADDEGEEGGAPPEAAGEADDAELAGAADDDEREAIRERRRQERHARKEHRRHRDEEQRRLIMSLRQENEQMQARLRAVEQRNAGTDLAQLDAAIEQAASVAEEAKRRIQAATEAADGKALAEANEVYYAARRRTEDLSSVKQQIWQARTAANNAPPRMDPRMVNQAQSWMQRNNWYDPAGTDPDSKVAIAIDDAVVKEGWDPRTPEYWQELDSRLKKYLPHRYKGGHNNGGGSRSSAATAKAIVGGSGGESGSASGGEGGFKVPAEYVNALKEAGLWDDPKTRAKMIAKYKEGRKNVA